jgi:hypothetical protein
METIVKKFTLLGAVEIKFLHANLPKRRVQKTQAKIAESRDSPTEKDRKTGLGFELGKQTRHAFDDQFNVANSDPAISCSQVVVVPRRIFRISQMPCGFGALAGDVKTFLLYFLLLPINAFRLRQMLNLVKKARSAT